MTLTDLRELTRKVPFVPFRIEISNGETYDVRHPDMILATPTTIAVVDRKNRMRIFAMEHVAGFQVPIRPAKKRS